jgi:hypothetical protein
VASVLPFQGGGDMWFSIEDRSEPGQSDRGAASVRRISPDYFSALRIPIQLGRVFTDRDRPGTSPVVVINRAMARAYWPDRDPVGQHIWIGKPMGAANTEPAPRQIVGVVGDIREASLAQLPVPALYIPYAQSPSASGGSFLVRTARPPLNLAPDVRAVVHALDEELPITGSATCGMSWPRPPSIGGFVQSSWAPLVRSRCSSPRLESTALSRAPSPDDGAQVRLSLATPGSAPTIYASCDRPAGS